ncbi:hypothetical protein [Polynucleobacter sp. MWH-UH23A]|uniref:hypothetical protein n=1 Tax=Polynucleobacter sp. MWH-UH23A TaxID=1855613 RepID=UPI003364C0A4
MDMTLQTTRDEMVSFDDLCVNRSIWHRNQRTQLATLARELGFQIFTIGSGQSQIRLGLRSDIETFFKKLDIGTFNDCLDRKSKGD